MFGLPVVDLNSPGPVTYIASATILFVALAIYLFMLWKDAGGSRDETAE
jgi:hypothetical protein